MSGYLGVFTGNMFCGKTRRLLEKASIFSSIGKKVILINSDTDTREDSRSDCVSTHNKFFTSIPATVATTKTRLLLDVEVKEYDVVLVDECQFFDDLLDAAKAWRKMGKIIFCAGLDGDYLGRPFGKTIELCPLADEFTKFTAVCQRCLESNSLPSRLENAPFTDRKVEDNRLVLAGGADVYIPVCYAHHSHLSK